jgi:hypothetical protein
MKKHLHLALAALGLLATTSANAQFPAGLESWKTDTSYLNIALIQLTDTFSFEDPNGWTSSNYITGADTFNPGPADGIFVKKSTSAHSGTYAAELTTDQVTLPLIGPTPIPGFILSGEFKFDIGALVGGGGFDPTTLPGTGLPVNGRLKGISAWINYTPVGNDSALVAGILRKGTTIVGQALKFVKGSTGGYTQVNVDFEYTSCETPDSLTLIFSSSNLFALQSLADQGTSGLPLGSKLLVDDVDTVTAGSGFTVKPIAVADDTATVKNGPVTIDVKANDLECQGSTLTVTGTTTPKHGTVTGSNGVLTYTPATDYLGKDTIYYTLTSANGTSTGILVVTTSPATGLNDVQNIAVALYPNPANNVLNIVAKSSNVNAVIYDIYGKAVVKSETFSNSTKVDVAALSNGTYFVALLNENGTVAGRSKFSVAK